MSHRSPRPNGFTILELVLLITVLAVLIALFIPGPQKHGFLDRVYKDASGELTEYMLFVPHGYRGEKPYPVIFFMHGRWGGYRVTEVGLGPAIRRTAPEKAKNRAGIWQAIRKKEKDFPFFVVFPRSKALWDTDSAETRRGFEVLDQMEKDYRIDKKRVYLTGLSNGGTATWYQAAKQPQRWAAIVPVSGNVRPELVPQIKHIPCWCFHGDADKSAPVEKTREMIEALRVAGGEPKYTELQSTGHNSWDDAYALPELYQWLLKQKLP
jgi:predicted peptidase